MLKLNQVNYIQLIESNISNNTVYMFYTYKCHLKNILHILCHLALTIIPCYVFTHSWKKTEHFVSYYNLKL